jgi:uncharacterized protein (DUF2147 family)
MNSTLKLVCSLGFLVSAPLAVDASEGVAGLWLTEKGDARIQVSPCGNALCGKVMWLRDPIDPATGRPQTDSKNPNASLAARPMIGVQLFLGMKPAGPGRWAGHIYNADDGGVYEGKLSLTGPGTLRVEGCLAAFCGGETWTRVGKR